MIYFSIVRLEPVMKIERKKVGTSVKEARAVRLKQFSNEQLYFNLLRVTERYTIQPII